ncbi:neuronal acetylcholine receptor subunit alpha-5-like, partial [Convolutriloba macropyga]|uniref:neuronal acetylcholine receptor subunit alpha-5-like n=1 Tax=Convolutriloba macropyga TaxID=536237 RepID=UPI003F526B50
SSCKRQELTSKGNRFSYLTFSANFKRLSDFYIRNLLLPNAGLLALSSLIFLLPAEQGDRIGFGVTLTLSLCVNLMIVTDFIPETSKTIPEICNYFLINIFLSSASIALATVSINLHLWFSKQQGTQKA